MEVSKISKHFSFHFFGLPGNWERGMLFSFNISSINVSALCVCVCVRREESVRVGQWERSESGKGHWVHTSLPSL